MHEFSSMFGIFKNKSQFEKTKRLCYYFARIYGFTHLRDEFTSFALEKMNNGRKAEIKHLAVDFIRHEYKIVRDTKRPKAVSISSLSKEFENLRHNKPLTLQDFSDACDKIGIDNINHRLLLFMLFYCGLDQKEIASFIGVTEARVSQMLSNIKQSVKKDEPASYP
jgi:helix-turn-helix protein